MSTLLSDPRRPATLYAGIDGGVLKSLDRGETWRRVGPEGFTASVYSVVLAGSRLLAGTTSGAYELLIAWEELSSSGEVLIRVRWYDALMRRATR